MLKFTSIHATSDFQQVNRKINRLKTQFMTIWALLLVRACQKQFQCKQLFN